MIPYRTVMTGFLLYIHPLEAYRKVSSGEAGQPLKLGLVMGLCVTLGRFLHLQNETVNIHILRVWRPRR